MRSTRDEMLLMGHLQDAETAFKINVSVTGHQAINGDIVQKSLKEFGMQTNETSIHRHASTSIPSKTL